MLNAVASKTQKIEIHLIEFLSADIRPRCKRVGALPLPFKKIEKKMGFASFKTSKAHL